MWCSLNRFSRLAERSGNSLCPRHNFCPLARYIRAYARSSLITLDHDKTEDSRHVTREDADLYVSILQSTATKREAKAYLQRYKPIHQNEAIDESRPSNEQPALPGHLYKTRNRQFLKNLLQQTRQQTTFDRFAEECFAPEILEDQLHLALVKIENVDELEDNTLRGIGKTLNQLQKLGLTAIVTFSLCSTTAGQYHRSDVLYEQADRIVMAIEGSRGKARQINGSIAKDRNGRTVIMMPSIIFAPLSRGIVPVVPPVAYDHVQVKTTVSANSILVALTKLVSNTLSSQMSGDTTSRQDKGLNVAAVERIIILDKAGGIPSGERGGASHVFINMQQEYQTLHRELAATGSGRTHIEILNTLRDCLKLLPSTASALITTPYAACSKLDAGTPKNPLIHNLLTDKPVFSSSLPVTSSSPVPNTTLIKQGTPLLMLPPSTFEHGFRLSNHPAIDLRRLVLLIEDSFGKKLDVDHYLARVDDNIAGIVIAGDYEGGAIITWEEGINGRRVPYLDKFAVARRSQGIGGVADIVFKAMVMGKDMFRDELVWRSKKHNPVNKWYFERSRGTYKLPGPWTMFWTTDDLTDNTATFDEYRTICQNVVPSLQE